MADDATEQQWVVPPSEERLEEARQRTGLPADNPVWLEMRTMLEAGAYPPEGISNLANWLDAHYEADDPERLEMAESSLHQRMENIRIGLWNPTTYDPPTNFRLEGFTDESKRKLEGMGRAWTGMMFHSLSDKGLVFLIANPFDSTPEHISKGAQAELDRRHAESMANSSRASYWLAFAVLVVALAQVALLVWQITA